MSRLAFTLSVVLPILVSARASATPVDPSFTESLFGSTIPGATGMGFAPDGSNRLFLPSKDGQVRILQDGVMLDPPFVTISPIYWLSECGLIGFAFDPDFVNNGFIYFFVTVAQTEQQIIRYRAEGNIGVDKTVIVSGLPTFGNNHDGGGLAFGPDGKLYWSIGDLGAFAGVGADLTSLGAKVGRANPDGSVPADNPFVDGEGPNNDYIWARGFRNPFTLTFQPATGRLWVNAVGTFYEQVFTPLAGDNAGWTQYENTQPAGFLAPVISYRTNGTDVLNISADEVSRLNGIATFGTVGAHGFKLGTKVTVSGVQDPSFNGTGYVVGLPSGDRFFSIEQPGPDARSGFGSVTTQAIGGCITGGAFWDSSAVPQPNRGAYFFGDCNSGRLMRATLSASNVVTSVDYWSADLGSMIDVTVGPDGDLYYVNHEGRVFRARYRFGDGLVVSKLHVRLAEAGGATFNVRLASAPAAPVAVQVARSQGDEDVTVTEGTTLVFSTTDWAVPKLVRLAAAEDDDELEDVAVLRVSAEGLDPVSVEARVTDLRSGGGGAGGAAGSAGAAGAAGAAAGAGGTAGAPPAGGAAGAPVGGGSGGIGVGGSAGEPGAAAGSAGTSGGSGGSGANGQDSDDDDSGCGCRIAGETARSSGWLLALGAALILGVRRTRAGRTSRRRAG